MFLKCAQCSDDITGDKRLYFSMVEETRVEGRKRSACRHRGPFCSHACATATFRLLASRGTVMGHG